MIKVKENKCLKHVLEDLSGKVDKLKSLLQKKKASIN